MTARRAIIFAGGAMTHPDWHRRQILETDYRIALDSGAHHLAALGLRPHLLIGDFDAVDPGLRQNCADDADVEVVHDSAQDTTDLQKALAHMKFFESYDHIAVFAGLGGRMDHCLGNLLAIGDLNRPERFVFREKGQDVRVLKQDFLFSGRIGDKIGILPLKQVGRLSYEGLKYPAESLPGPVDLGWLGVSNEMAAERAAIRLEDGLVLFTHWSGE